MYLNLRLFSSCLVAFLAIVVVTCGNAVSALEPEYFFQPPVNLGPMINGAYDDSSPAITSDGLTLIFSSDRPDGYGDRDLWQSTRATIADSWTTPENLGGLVNSASRDTGTELSADGLTLYYNSVNAG